MVEDAGAYGRVAARGSVLALSFRVSRLGRRRPCGTRARQPRTSGGGAPASTWRRGSKRACYDHRFSREGALMRRPCGVWPTTSARCRSEEAACSEAFWAEVSEDPMPSRWADRRHRDAGGSREARRREPAHLATAGPSSGEKPPASQQPPGRLQPSWTFSSPSSWSGSASGREWSRRGLVAERVSFGAVAVGSFVSLNTSTEICSSAVGYGPCQTSEQSHHHEAADSLQLPSGRQLD
jgi:hypothetical protein